MKIQVLANPLEKEWNILLQIKDNYQFFVKNGYSLYLPSNDKLREFVITDKEYSQNELNSIRSIFDAEYDKSSYDLCIQRLKKEIPDLSPFCKIFTDWAKSSSFKFFDNYNIFVTHYGPGGDSNYSEKYKVGIIIRAGRPDGELKNKNVLGSILHEMVHIGIDQSIGERFCLNFFDREGVVDYICEVLLKLQLDSYTRGTAPDNRLRLHLEKNRVTTIEALFESVKEYSEEITSQPS